MKINKTSLGKIKKFCMKHDFIRLCYLFGSYAEGKETKLSDLDLGFLLDRTLSKNDRHKKKLFLMNEISSLLQTNKVDIVIMNDANYRLNYEIIKHCNTLYGKDENERVDFEVSVMDTYLDRRYYDTRHANYLMKTLTEEQ